MPQQKSTTLQAHLAFEFLCGSFSFYAKEFFTGLALNSALSKERKHQKGNLRAHFHHLTEHPNAHLHIKMGFANVWGSHPKDNAKGGRAWYVCAVLFPNDERDFFSLFCAFFFFLFVFAAAETP